MASNEAGAALTGLPLFANDKQLAEAVFGKQRAKDWPRFVALYEGRGLPPLDAVAGGRYVPAVRQFLDALYGVNGAAPYPASDGLEEESKWHGRATKSQA